MPLRASSRIGQWLALVAAVLLLNLAPSFHNVWPTPWITARWELSVEAAAIVLLLVVVGARYGHVPSRLINGLAIVLMLLVLARYLEVTAPALYGRGINLYWDAPHLPAVAAMVAGSVAPWLLVVATLGACLALLAIFLAFRWALRRIAAAQQERRRTLGIVAGGLVATYLFAYYASVGPLLRWFSIPVTMTYVRQVEFIAEALAGGGAAAELPVDDPLAAWDWVERPTTDVFVVFVESYGAIAYDDPEIAALLAPHRAELATEIRARGGALVSGFVTSPTFGGVSWLAHSSLMTGIDVTDSGAYNVLLTQQRETLADRFAAAGYRTVALMPGLRGDWPEGSFYGFDRIYGERAIEYAGPAFGWWRVPDQYALAQLDRSEIAAHERAPLFVFFPTISTHLPFAPTPPLQRDWDRLLGPEPYPPALLADAAAPDLLDLRPAYAGALAYTYDYLAAYLQSRKPRDYVLLVLGDHQPPANVAGQGARWDVPVHVAASDPAVLAPFVGAGFIAGSEPAPEPLARTHEVGMLLLEALGARRVGQLQ